MHHNYQAYIERWLAGEVTGARDSTGTALSMHVRRYLFNKYNSSCASCGWDKINPATGNSPLEVHHLDDDCTNHREDNLVLLCPNCHSLTSSFRALNKGSGRRR